LPLEPVCTQTAGGNAIIARTESRYRVEKTRSTRQHYRARRPDRRGHHPTNIPQTCGAAAQPFAWTATADEILAKVRWVEANVKQLLANNSK